MKERSGCIKFDDHYTTLKDDVSVKVQPKGELLEPLMEGQLIKQRVQSLKMTPSAKIISKPLHTEKNKCRFWWPSPC